MELNIPKRVCNTCMKSHARVFSGKKGKESFWRDEHGLLWNGKMCGVCNRIRLRVAVAKHREKKLNESISK